MQKIKVGLLGATGLVGQQYAALLANHPWFELSFIASSASSCKKTFQEATQSRRFFSTSSAINSLVLSDIADIHKAKRECEFVFSALSNEAAQEFEERYASANIPVISNASCHRMKKDVPLIIPEINASHLTLIDQQRKERGWEKGFLIAKPNCSLQSYLLPLFPLHQKLKISKVLVTTMQAISGAGYPGASSLEISDNVIPYIDGEEEKSELEPLKILGTCDKSGIKSASGIEISAHCNRVPVLDGHLACVSVAFEKSTSLSEILTLWQEFQAEPQLAKLPTAPHPTLLYKEEPNRPQTRLDRLEGNGMTVTLGRLRSCSVLQYKFVALSHNVLRGAAGGGLLNAELLKHLGYLGS